MTAISTILLNDNHGIPQLGLGMWQVPNAQAPDVIATALDAGYRSIDTAAAYQNETGTGEALRKTQIPRDRIYVTTKLWNSDHGFDSALKAMDASLGRLGLAHVDLYLIHWPLPMRNQYPDTWRALIRLRDEGKAKSIGVSNFNIAHLQRLIDETGVTPAVNQIELHPHFPQAGLRAFHAKHGIVTESWSPLGQGTLFQDATLLSIAQKHGRTVAQIILRWHIELGLVAIPKSVTHSRIRENLVLSGFRLDAGDMAAIAKLDRGAAGRIGPDPETFSMA
jgi:2,5-diketo-D-gluconate reductase A